MNMFQSSPEEFGKRIRYYREKNGYTQEQLAELLDISPQTLLRYEKGRSVPSTTMVLKISQALNISPSLILLPVEDKKFEFSGENGECTLFAKPEHPEQIPEILDEEPKF